MMISNRLLNDIVYGAIENKYGMEDQELRELVTKLVTQVSDASKGRALISPAKVIEQDIINQILTLRIVLGLSSDAEKELECGKPISFIHSLLTGVSEPSKYRVEEYVADLGGDALTQANEIPARLDELERQVVFSAQSLNRASIAIQASWLAQVFSAIIRVHPFPDANGRTARSVAFYLLASWNRNLFVIPKVRNEPEWKSALSLAINGNCSVLSSYFVRKISDHSSHQEGEEDEG